jgi:COMPASS component SPP1
VIQVSHHICSKIFVAITFLGRPVGLDYLTPDEQQEIEEIMTKKAAIEAKIKGYQDQQKVLLMVNKRAKIAAQQPNLEVKDICGYDNRLSFNEAQFARWAMTIEGITALTSGVLGPRTDETKDISAIIPFPGQSPPAATASAEALNNICLKKMKKCKHAAWREVHNQDYVYNQKILKDDLERLSKLETELIDDAETREATKDYYADNVTEQLF